MKARFYIQEHPLMDAEAGSNFYWRLIIPEPGAGVLVPLHCWPCRSAARADAIHCLNALGFDDVDEVPVP